MKKFDKLWIPRILTIIFILFISLFALDAFSGEALLGQEILAFIIHLIPSFILIAILLYSWKDATVTGIVFVMFSIATIVFFDTYEHIITFLVVTFPVLLIGVLYIIINYLNKKNAM